MFLWKYEAKFSIKSELAKTSHNDPKSANNNQ